MPLVSLCLPPPVIDMGLGYGSNGFYLLWVCPLAPRFVSHTSPPVSTCTYTVVLVVLSITDEGNQPVLLWASVFKQPKHDSS